MWMTAQSLKSARMKSLTIPNNTSSPESVDGPSRSEWQDGPMTDLFGREAVPVSRSHAPAKAKAKPTKGTCGQCSATSSRSENLQSRLASRLQARLAGRGSPGFVLTWKEWDMPSGPPICVLQASARRTPDSAYIGLPTPQSMDAKGYSDALRHKFRKTGHLKHWTHGTALAIHSKTGVSSWPNPMLHEWLMGFPRLWISGHDYTPTGTPSCRKSPQSS
jgi:hypothetical protein